MEYVLAVEALGMNLNFLIIILVVLAVILTAVVVLAMYRSGVFVLKGTILPDFMCIIILAVILTAVVVPASYM